MTLTGFNPDDTRSLAARMVDAEREAQAHAISNRQFVIAFAAILVALALFGLLLTFL
jgi:hypothetical protein